MASSFSRVKAASVQQFPFLPLPWIGKWLGTWDARADVENFFRRRGGTNVDITNDERVKEQGS